MHAHAHIHDRAHTKVYWMTMLRPSLANHLCPAEDYPCLESSLHSRTLKLTHAHAHKHAHAHFYSFTRTLTHERQTQTQTHPHAQTQIQTHTHRHTDIYAAQEPRGERGGDKLLLHHNAAAISSHPVLREDCPCHSSSWSSVKPRAKCDSTS